MDLSAKDTSIVSSAWFGEADGGVLGAPRTSIFFSVLRTYNCGLLVCGCFYCCFI